MVVLYVGQLESEEYMLNVEEDQKSNHLVVKMSSLAECNYIYCIYHYKTNRIYDGVEAETRKSQARFQII